MLAPGNYIQWKSRIKRYIDTKPNRELIHFCLTNPPYKLELVKQSQELKHVSYHKLYDILKQHQHEVNEIRAEKIARVDNLLALVAKQQQVYHPHTHPTHFNQNSSIRMHPAATRKREKAIVNSPQPIYDQEPSMVDDDEDTSKEKEIDKLMAFISLSFKKIYKPTNNNLRTSSNTSRTNQDNTEMLGMKVKGVLNAEQADWKDDTDDESDDQELEAHYMYMAKLQQVSPVVDDSGPIFDTEPEQKIEQNDEDVDIAKERQSVQTMNMLNNKCRTSFAKPEYLKKAKQANPRLYDIGCYNDNLALMLSPKSDEVI
nr:hypothetical protein [Tanacetum cinerariifolium]